MLDPRDWFGGHDDEDDDPVTKTLRYLGLESAGNAVAQGVQDVGAGIGQAAANVGAAVQPYLPQPSASPAPEDYSFAPPDNPLATGLSAAGKAGVEAYQETGGPISPWSAPAMAPARAAYIAERALPEIGGEIGAAAGRAAAGPDAAPYLTVPESVPVVGGQDVGAEEVGRFIGSGLTDPLTYVGAAGAAAAGAPARRVAAELARGLPGVGEAELLGRGAVGAVRGLGSRAGEALGLAGNAERVAAADARMAAEGSTLAPGTFGALPGGPNLEDRIAAAEARLEHAGTRLEAADAMLAQAADAGSAAELRAARSGYSPARSAYDEAAARVEQLREQRRMVSRDIEGAGYGRPVEDAGIDTSAVEREATSAYGGQPDAVPPFRDDAPRSISLNAGFGVAPEAPSGGAAAARRLSDLEAAGAPESTLQKWRALAEADVADPAGLAERLRTVEMVTPEDARAMLGERPEYLAPVAQFLLDQRRKVMGGGMTARDVGKAYYMTLMSMRSTAQEQGALQRKLASGFATGAGEAVPPNPQLGDLDAMVNVHNGRPLGPIFTEPGPNGRRIVRPESAGAAWVWTDEGQRALNALDEGEFLPDAWEGGRRARLAFGSDTVGGNGALRPLTEAEVRAGKVNLTNLPAFVDELNEGIGALKAAGRESEVGAYLSEHAKRLMGIGTGKSPFIKQLLGFGDAVTIDAREINYWLSGRGLLRPGDASPGANMARAASRWWGSERRVAETLQPRIQAAVDDLAARYPELTEGIDPADAGHILHHWIWDRSGGSSTAHTDVMASQRLAGTAGVVPDAARPDRLASVNRVLGQGVASSVSGGVGAQVNQEMNPDDPLAGIKGFAAGALVPPLAARGGMALARRAGAGGAREGGALAAFGLAPGSGGLGGQGATPPGGGLFDIFPQAAAAYRTATARNAAEMAREGITPASKAAIVRGTAGTVGYSSLMGPATMTVNLATGLMQPIWAAPKEPLRAGVRAITTRNMAALREPAAALGGAWTATGKLGGAVWDVVRGRGAFAPNPDSPPISSRVADPFLRGVLGALETPGRVWSSLPDAVVGTYTQHMVEARRAAQLATDMGKTGKAWQDWVDLYLAEAERVRSTGSKQVGAGTADVLASGADAAARAGLRQPLGTIGAQVRKVARLGDMPVVGDLVAPFFNSPWNAHLQQLERSPVGLAMNTQPTKFDKYYDATVGSAAVVGMAELVRRGQATVNGSGPSEQNERQAWLDLGNRPYSIRMGPVTIPNRALGYAEGLLNAVGETSDYLKFKKTDATPRALTEEKLARIGKLIKQAPYAAGYASIADAIEYGLPSFGADVATRLTPAAATLRGIGTALDTAERTTDRGTDVPMTDEALQRWQASTGQRSDLPVAQNILGEPKPNPQAGAAAFFARLGYPHDDPVIAAFREVRTFPGNPPSEVRGIRLTPDEKRRWDAYRGEALRELVPDMVDSVRDEPVAVREKVLRNAFGTAGRIAAGRLIESMGDDFETRLEAAAEKQRAERERMTP